MRGKRLRIGMRAGHAFVKNLRRGHYDIAPTSNQAVSSRRHSPKLAPRHLDREALAIGANTGSAEILTELAQLNDKLTPWNTVPAVIDFRTALQDTILHQT